MLKFGIYDMVNEMGYKIVWGLFLKSIVNIRYVFWNFNSSILSTSSVTKY